MNHFNTRVLCTWGKQKGKQLQEESTDYWAKNQISIIVHVF